MRADLPTFSHAVTLDPFCQRRAEFAKSTHSKSTDLETRFQSLAIILERLWVFYEAMRTGKPIGNADEMLAEMGAALTKGRRPTASLPKQI